MEVRLKLGMDMRIRQFVFIKRYDRYALARRRLGCRMDMSHVNREIQILRGLRHPNVVQLYRVVATKESRYIYIIMEYVSGGSMMEKICRVGRLPERLVNRYFVEIVNGLEYLHECHVIHRDIKPENLLLTGDEKRVKICDFSVAHCFEEDDRLNDSEGTAVFLAPELISELQEPRGRAVDIWALGVTLYYFVFGVYPFFESDLVGTFRKIQFEPLSFPEHVPVSFELKDMLNRLLMKDPTRRVTMEGIRRHPWYLNGVVYRSV